MTPMTEKEPQNLSVIVPVRNEVERIEHLLHSLVSQDCPTIIEFLLIDGRSEDGTCEAIAEFAKNDQRFKLLDNPEKVVTHALNIGLTHATGDIIIRMDAHAEYATDYVTQCLNVLEETGAGNVGGPAVPASDGSLIGDVILSIHESPFGIGAAKFRRADAEGWVDTVWPGAYRREALEDAGMYYVEELTRSEDIELNSRLRRAGWRVYLSPKIKAVYYPRKSIPGLSTQNFGNGAAVIHTLKAGLGGVSIRHLVPLFFVLSLLIAGLFAAFTTWGRLALLAILGLYGFANLLFSAKAAQKHGLRVLTFLPVTFLLLHLAYGWGSLYGILSKPRRAESSESQPQVN